MAQNLFGVETLFEEDEAEVLLNEHDSRIKIVGWPMEYLKNTMALYANVEKKPKIIFPHRLAPEKQLEIFKDLAKEMPEYEWFVAQEHKLTKDEYHTHMAESKIMFSANLQETLGITSYEAALVGTLPMVPNRLSYSEMWSTIYPSVWTEGWDNYQKHKAELIQTIRSIMNSNKRVDKHAQEMGAEVGDKFFCGDALYTAIKSA